MTSEIQVCKIQYYFPVTCMILYITLWYIFSIYAQTVVIDEAAKAHPNSWWWVKADGCDLVSGLGESTRCVWSGDIDLNDGELSKLRESYQKRLDFIGGTGLDERSGNMCVLEDITTCIDNCSKDIRFLTHSKWYQ